MPPSRRSVLYSPIALRTTEQREARDLFDDDVDINYVNRELPFAVRYDEDDVPVRHRTPSLLPPSDPFSPFDDQGEDDRPGPPSDGVHSRGGSDNEGDHVQDGSVRRSPIGPMEESDSGINEDRDASTHTQRKHGRISDGSTRDLQPTPKVPRRHCADNRKCRGDYPPVTQEALDRSTDHYRALLATECLYPDAKQEPRFIQQSWRLACKEMEVRVYRDTDLHRLVAREATQFRSESKKAVRAIVAQEYGFKNGRSDRTKKHNFVLAAKLKNDCGFICPLDELEKPKEERKRLYRNSAITAFINVILFKHRSSLGITHSSYFGIIMPKPTVTFALLEFGISEWETGVFIDTKFNQLDWTQKYLRHFADLEAFDKATARANIYKQIGTLLLEDGRRCTCRRGTCDIGPGEAEDLHGESPAPPEDD
ncbi:hypothetical protein NM688_g9342 [Phlebia brevispora]|uniref:Uncharacterized protein n=1 Tax=Phlebia brevispora TaxID=194682 RepID=A0ACC1RJG4_9APHY|nr:hypothetical protein NM688_g9342 [Phlebia brevispora]